METKILKLKTVEILNRRQSRRAWCGTI